MDLQKLAQKSIELHKKMKNYEEQLRTANAALLAAMLAENVSTIEVKNKTVSVVNRRNKDFGNEIKRQELNLKAEKKRLEVLGEFTISSVTQYIKID